MRDTEDPVILRRKSTADRNGNKRLSWSISDLSALPIVKTNSISKPKYQRIRNASISSCSLSSGSSNFSLRSNGSFRRKARIPVTGFTERAFLANELKMTSDADIIVKEDLEYLSQVENETHTKSSECDKHDDPLPHAESVTNTRDQQQKFKEPIHDTKKCYSQNSFRESQVEDDRKCEKERKRMMSISSIASRESLTSVSSFSSRIFHWRKSSTKSVKSPDRDSSMSIVFPEPTIELVQNLNVQDQQIDKIAAKSLASYNSVNDQNEDDECFR